METHMLRLFITGKTARSQAAIQNLSEVCETYLAGRYELEIIDLLEDPEIAEIEKILQTPTLIKIYPAPTRRIIGDLSNREQLLAGLDLYGSSFAAGTEGQS